MRTAFRLVALKSIENSNDVKFPAAILENYRAASPKWRPHLLAIPCMAARHANGGFACIKQAREAMR